MVDETSGMRNSGSAEADVRRDAIRSLMSISRGLQQLRATREGREDRSGHGDQSNHRRPTWADETQGQGRVLALLKLQPETTQRDLTYLLGMSRQGAAELLAKLDAKGLITRQPSETDRRVVTVKLTEAGHEAAVAQASDGPRHRHRTLDVLTDDEATQLAHLLAKVEHQLRQELGEKFPERRRPERGFRRASSAERPH